MNVPISRFIVSLGLCAAALGFLPIVLSYPEQGFFYGPIVIPDFTGIFLRSFVMGLLFLAVWVYRYGFAQTLLLGFCYWGLGGMIFDLTNAIAWGGNVFANFSILLTHGQSFAGLLLRIAILPMATATTFIFRLYRVNLLSVAIFSMWVSLLVSGALFLPHNWSLGEVYIPNAFLPQLYEFLSVSASFAFALAFFRPHKWGAQS